ncbi:YbaB/EbfC family nucleoid-associated protein [Ancylobacter defluvii]|uniref:Nucleoid-associated protein GCM10017653_33120 n=1 Tax=Ancylobacter defluvii TaxID=1282440 RepID=A0A9W6NC39_9HYPH|nr:YbaB/EbfC family nucleoid-associated protein [Ancylobacter defluvii]MBS7589623.1 YbaB/EbfC family nucleoid-associated protein [Ancylobacter defluvii]GLK85242.1 nucleoid-associated protein [Ancylobacter defluvii]
MKDLLGMMSKVKEMQARMEQMQAELDAIEVEGASGGGMVTVRMSAKGALKGVTIDPSLLKPEESEILEDLIVAAHGDARAKGERLILERTQALTAGLPIPPGLKLF